MVIPKRHQIKLKKKITLASYNSETSKDIISSPLSPFSVTKSEEFVISLKLKNKLLLKLISHTDLFSM